MAGGGAVDQLRAKLPWLLRGGALVGTGALLGLGIGVALGAPGMATRFSDGPEKRVVRTRQPGPSLAARAPTPTPPVEPAPAPAPGPAVAPGPGAAPDPATGMPAPGLVLGPTAPPKPAPSALPAGGSEVIQVAATPFRPLAEAVRKRLTDVGYQSYVDTVVLEGRQRFRVRVDSAGRDTATVAAELKALGYPVWVTKE